MGTNAHVSMITCLDCGHSEKRKKDQNPTHDPESCPHELTDRRGSTAKWTMTWCKQCCMHIDIRDREKMESFKPTNSKLEVASTEQQKLATKILEERTLDVTQVDLCLKVYTTMLADIMKTEPTITSTKMKLILEDAFDAVRQKTAYMNVCPDLAAESSTAADSGNQPTMKKELPTVDIFEDPGIWICLDEGCNSNCHGSGWAENAEAKLATFREARSLDCGFEWIHRCVRNFNGIGDAKVQTLGKRKMPTAFMLTNSKKILPGFLQSHEQMGNHPLLLSDESQSRMGFVKDMREGVCYLKDYDGYLEMYRAKGSGLKVVCISHFPRGRITLEMFVGADPAKIIATQAEKDRIVLERKRSRSVSVSPQHPLLVANPATMEKAPEETPTRAASLVVREVRMEKDKAEIPTITVASFGIEIARKLSNPAPEGREFSPQFS